MSIGQGKLLLVYSASRRCASTRPRCGHELSSFDRVADLLSVPAVLGDVEPDYICISGTLNTMDEEAARRLVSAAFDAAAQGVIFNFLSDRPHPRHEGKDLSPASRFDTVRWIDWALGRSSRVSFTQAYLDGHDATIMIEHDG